MQYQLKSIPSTPFILMSLLQTNPAFFLILFFSAGEPEVYVVRDTCPKCVSPFYFQDHHSLVSLTSCNAVQECKLCIAVWIKTQVGCECISQSVDFPHKWGHTFPFKLWGCQLCRLGVYPFLPPSSSLHPY